jgi:S1-C subfamily serine protease
VQVRPVTVADIPAFRLPASKGLVVVSVEKGGMAEAMQIQAGDIFLSVNGTDLANLQVFAQAIQVGGAKTFQVWHNGQLSELVVPLSL